MNQNGRDPFCVPACAQMKNSLRVPPKWFVCLLTCHFPTTEPNWSELISKGYFPKIQKPCSFNFILNSLPCLVASISYSMEPEFTDTNPAFTFLLFSLQSPFSTGSSAKTHHIHSPPVHLICIRRRKWSFSEILRCTFAQMTMSWDKWNVHELTYSYSVRSC